MDRWARPRPVGAVAEDAASTTRSPARARRSRFGRARAVVRARRRLRHRRLLASPSNTRMAASLSSRTWSRSSCLRRVLIGTLTRPALMMAKSTSTSSSRLGSSSATRALGSGARPSRACASRFDRCSTSPEGDRSPAVLHRGPPSEPGRRAADQRGEVRHERPFIRATARAVVKHCGHADHTMARLMAQVPAGAGRIDEPTRSHLSEGSTRTTRSGIAVEPVYTPSLTRPRGGVTATRSDQPPRVRSRSRAASTAPDTWASRG